MSKELERPMSQDTLGTLTQTITVKKKPLADGVPDPRPKVRYVTIKETSVLKILGAVVDALQQKGLQDRADELRKQLEAQGIVLEDNGAGQTTWKKIK